MDILAFDREVETRSRRSAREGWLLVAGDLLVLATAFLAARTVNWFVHGHSLEMAFLGWRVETGDERLVVYAALMAVAVLLFWRLGHYGRRRPFWQETGDVLVVIAGLALIDATLVFLAKANVSRLWLVSTWLLVALSLPCARILLKRGLLSMGAWRRPTVIFGTGPTAIDAASAIASEPLMGFDVIAFLSPAGEAPAYIEVDGRRFPVLRAGPYPSILPPHLGRPHVVVALEMGEMATHGRLVERLSLALRDVDVVSPMRGLPLARTEVTHFFSHDVLALRLHNNLARPLPRLVKRGFDILVGSAFLVLALPLFAAIALGLRRSGPGVIYGHRRIGAGGRPFTCYKFRTMVPDADRVLEEVFARDPAARIEWEHTRKLRTDPRITRLGCWLRRWSLDELPQLWNVLRGDMSLVGPRPVCDDELPRYGDNLVYYLETKPGLTGLWQISGRSDVDYRRRVHLDCWYVKNWTLWYDIVILLKTWRAVLGRNGAY